MSRALSIALAALGLVAVVAACGSSTPKGTPSFKPSDAGRTQAEASLLLIGDLPNTWRKRAGGRGNSRDLSGFGCEGFRPDLSALTVKGIHAGVFWVPGKRQLSDLAIVYKTKADATTAFNENFAKLFDRCVRKVVGKKSSSGTILTATRLSLQLGVRNFAYGSTFEVDVSKKLHPAYAHNVFVLVGRSAAVGRPPSCS